MSRAIVVGGGIIGASIAYHLSCAGVAVRIVEGGQVASGASGTSFGWINASFFADEHHFQLRAEGIAAWHRLQVDLPDLTVAWPGSLWWEEQGAAFDGMAAKLAGLGYPFDVLKSAQITELEPVLANPPDRALLFPDEGVAEADLATHQVLAAASANGAKVLTGLPVTGIATRNGQVVGVETEAGTLEADYVIVACGIGSEALLSQVGVALPMLRRPGLILRSQPIAERLNHILVAPGQELRQDSRGRIIAPTVASHQSDESTEITDRPDHLASQTTARLRKLLNCENEFEWEQVSLAHRPVPVDGLPVVGACGPEGLYAAVMHSGVTLATVVGELAAKEIAGGTKADLLEPYRPARFA